MTFSPLLSFSFPSLTHTLPIHDVMIHMFHDDTDSWTLPLWLVSAHTSEARLSCGVSSNSWSRSSCRGVATAAYPPAVRCRKSNMSRQEMVPSECTNPPPTSRNCTGPRRGRVQRRKVLTSVFFSLRGFRNSPLGNRPWGTQTVRFMLLPLYHLCYI